MSSRQLINQGLFTRREGKPGARVGLPYDTTPNLHAVVRVVIGKFPQNVFFGWVFFDSSGPVNGYFQWKNISATLNHAFPSFWGRFCRLF